MCATWLNDRMVQQALPGLPSRWRNVCQKVLCSEQWFSPGPRGFFFFFNTRAKKECYEAITLEYHILLRKDSIKILEARGMNVDTFLFFHLQHYSGNMAW